MDKRDSKGTEGFDLLEDEETRYVASTYLTLQNKKVLVIDLNSILTQANMLVGDENNQGNAISVVLDTILEELLKR